MAKGKIHHWKHGWIPLDAFARAQMASHRKKLGLTVDEKRAELDKRRAARGEGPLLPKKRAPRKPPNWVPQGDNVPKWKPPTAADLRKILADESAKDAAKAAPRIKAVKEAGKPSKVEYVKGVYRIKDAKGTVLSRTSDRHSANAWLARNGVDFDKANDMTAEAKTEASSAEMRKERYRTLTTVDGVDFVTYKSSSMDPMGGDHGLPYQLTPDQMQPLADAYNEVKAEFPTLEPIQVVGVDGKTGAFGITSWDGRRISISKDTFDEAKIKYAAQQWGDHGAIAGQFVDDPEGFARAVMTHELGHALQMQNREAMRKGQELALERVTPADMGVDTSAWAPDAVKAKAMRWEVDTLNHQSVYATGNKFEWFAEAFADAWFNGDKAQPQSKRALLMLRQAYGVQKLGRIPIPKPGNFVQKGVVS